MNKILLIILLLLNLFLPSCKKYLDEKPDSNLTIPTSLNEFQALLDYEDNTENSTPGALDIGCDDYYLEYPTYLEYDQIIRNMHVWASDIWEGASDRGDWSNPYSIIYRANVVIEELKGVEVFSEAERSMYNRIYGHALFLRAFMHYFLEETFGQPYKPSSANSDLGIPLKLTSDLRDISIRSSVQQVFASIINDLKQAVVLLPNTSSQKNRPSRAAAYGMLARVFLTIQDYNNAGLYSDKALRIIDTLFDYNNIPNPTVINPFLRPPNDFIEILYASYQNSWDVIRQPTTIVDSTLFESYDSNDLRKTVYFRPITSTNSWNFKGNYSGTTTRQLSGLTIDEMYLIRAECHARLNNKIAALNDLNALLVKRWKAGSFVPIEVNSAEEALTIIIKERRKELIFRSLRWIDLRRLNQDPRFSTSLKRVINGQIYILPPGDKKYTYPIPDQEIRISGLQQNQR